MVRCAVKCNAHITQHMAAAPVRMLQCFHCVRFVVLTRCHSGCGPMLYDSTCCWLHRFWCSPKQRHDAHHSAAAKGIHACVLHAPSWVQQCTNCKGVLAGTMLHTGTMFA